MSDKLINGTFVKTQKVCSYRYIIAKVVPHCSATIIIILFDELKYEVYRFNKELVGDEYDAWGIDDSYLDIIVEQEVKKFVTIDC
jgi:hypothetical protein